MEFVNIALLRQPLNWIVILLMLIIFAIFSDVVLSHYTELRESLNPNPVARQ